ncbi:hypothetical protein [Halovenus salina]|uniref:hypothetical protein n=1 Tax=Halovenus salina TaxID=1510225 RepID=UPI002260E9D1|nr:hypothetical protein [Halovenus salina]
MSQTPEVEADVPETIVRSRSRYTNVLHRPDPDSDEPYPACPVRDSEKEYTEAPAKAYLGHYDLCENPECFGREWR